ncbi:MAG: hypothetical protein IJF96_05560 [Firmicutes bacterium]|nr:hypothetical protein [Bacillota bacterium]
MEITALIISAVSLVIAIMSFAFSSKSQHLQDRVNEIELKLKEYELAEKEQQKAPCVEARINHIAKENYRIKIWNSGNAAAKNVTASWDKGSQILFFDQEKMPFELLEPQKSFELAISTYCGSPRKLCITTTWEDGDEKKHSKEQWCDL